MLDFLPFSRPSPGEEAIAAAITPRTRAIIPVHYAGVPANMDAIHVIKNMTCAKGGLVVTDDDLLAEQIQKYYRERFPAPELPHTEWNSERLLSILLFSDMTYDDTSRVIDALRKLTSS